MNLGETSRFGLLNHESDSRGFRFGKAVLAHLARDECMIDIGTLAGLDGERDGVSR